MAQCMAHKKESTLHNYCLINWPIFYVVGSAADRLQIIYQFFRGCVSCRTTLGLIYWPPPLICVRLCVCVCVRVCVCVCVCVCVFVFVYMWVGLSKRGHILYVFGKSRLFVWVMVYTRHHSPSSSPFLLPSLPLSALNSSGFALGFEV